MLQELSLTLITKTAMKTTLKHATFINIYYTTFKSIKKSKVIKTG